MKPAPFAYHRPELVADAHSLLVEFGDEAKVLAGGQSLVPMLALRLTRFEHLVDLDAIDELRELRVNDGNLFLGAMTRQRVLERDPTVAAAVPLLARAAPHIGHFQIRNRGTVGGSLAHADPASELPAVAVALDAEFTTNTRTLSATEFFVDPWTTALADDEIVIGVNFPAWSGHVRAAVVEVARRAGDFALAGAAIQVEIVDELIVRAAIALFGVGPTPLRAHAAEAALTGGADAAEVAALAVRGADPNDDIHATADQRRAMAAAVVRRALAEVAA